MSSRSALLLASSLLFLSCQVAPGTADIQQGPSSGADGSSAARENPGARLLDKRPGTWFLNSSATEKSWLPSTKRTGALDFIMIGKTTS